MAWDTFVYDNIKKELLKEGFPLAVAHNGAEYGADHYRRMSQASRKGGAFDDCLVRARRHVLPGCTKEEKPAKVARKTKSRAAATAGSSLF